MEFFNPSGKPNLNQSIINRHYTAGTKGPMMYRVAGREITFAPINYC